MTSPAVHIENLSRHFGQFKAVDNISLTIERGEIFGFLGANGAGKTTAIRMLCGLLKPTSGTGRVAALDIYKQSEQIKKIIGYMSQKFSLYTDLTGLENMQFYGAAYGLSHRDVNDQIGRLSKRLSLEMLLDRRCSTLPIGWRQRLALAVSLLHRPQLLFLDEPTSGVDPVYRRHFWKILYELAEEGVTIFVTTHYMDEAEYCGRISVMHQGRIIELGKPLVIIRKHGRTNLEETFVELISNEDRIRAAN
jgi:ABC-2 type transport system ATP-binding protein